MDKKGKGIGGHSTPRKGATDSWITPKYIIDDLGPFDLDPCQCDPQPWPCASRAFTAEQNGLTQEWSGRVWCNPPYSNAWVWLDRLADHGTGTALIFARTETRGFVSEVWGKATAILFLHGRLFFHRPNGDRAGGSGGPSCLVAYGDYDAERLRVSRLKGTFLELNKGLW